MGAIFSSCRNRKKLEGCHLSDDDFEVSDNDRRILKEDLQRWFRENNARSRSRSF